MQSADEEISLLEIWLILREDWKIIVGVTVGAIAIAITAGILMTPMYRAEAVIKVVESKSSQGGAASLLAQFGGLGSFAGSNLRGLDASSSGGLTTIRSRTFIEEFIRRNELMPILYSDRWDSEANDWDGEVLSPPEAWQGANYFLNNVFFLPEDVETGLYSIVIEWPDPVLATHWANDLVAMVNETIRMRDIAESRRRIAFLNEQVSKTSVVELQQVLYNLLEIEQQTLMLADAREEYAFQIVDPAVEPKSPSKPNRLFLLIIGVVLGGFLGLALVFAKRLIAGLRSQEARMLRQV